MPKRSASSPSEDGSVAEPPVRLGQHVLGADCHAHVFTRDLPLAAGRRYAPAYDASIPNYLQMLRGNGMSHGVLVQPSFLGTDNTFLLEGLRQAPDRLRGIVVVAPEIADDELQNLGRAGCAGIRLNLLGQSDPEFSSTGWQRHLQRLAALNWQVEVQAEARRLPGILPRLLSAGLHVVVDHFGRPSASAGVDDPGFRYLLTTGATRRVWVKLSGAYRIGRQGSGDRIACAAMPLLREAFGLDRLVWGSDWPHTQYEQHVTAAAARRSLDEWLPDPADRRTVLVETPSRLFRFGEHDSSLHSPCQSHTGSN